MNIDISDLLQVLNTALNRTSVCMTVDFMNPKVIDENAKAALQITYWDHTSNIIVIY